MTFVLRMAVREMRAAWQRLLFFFICIAVGVAAIVALRSVIRSVRDVLGGEARSLIAADVLISTNRDWTPEARATIDRRLAEAGSTARTETIETPTMVRPVDAAKVATRMVELKAVQAPFPLYGTLTLEGGQPYTHSTPRESRRARAARAADGARRRGGRFADHRGGRVHHPRRRGERARAQHRRLQPRPARLHRLRRRAVDRPASRSAAAFATCSPCACPTTGFRPWSRRWTTTSRTTSSTRGRTCPPTTRSAATSIGRRTT